MLNYSFSTVLMTVLTSTLLICIIAVCFQRKKVLLSIGYKLLGAFLLMTLLRFILPFEVPFTKTIILPEFVSMVIVCIRHPFWTLKGIEISVWFLFECIWICGSVVAAVYIFRRNFLFNRYVCRYGVDVTEKEPYNFLLNEVCDSHKSNPRVILVPGLDTPRQNGFLHPTILIPEGLTLDDTQLYYTLCHELSHFRHGHYLIKLGMNILLAVYWWNPLCHILNRQMDILLEMSVDESLVCHDPNARTSYLNTLIYIGNSVADLQKSSKHPEYLLSSRAVSGIKDLTTRVHLIYRDNPISKPIFLTLLALVTSLFVCSYCFIFEAHYLLKEAELQTPEIFATDMYAIMLEDRTYEIYWNEQLLEHVDSLELHPDVPVINP